MTRISFTEDQFLIVVGMSESSINSIEFDSTQKTQLNITMSNVNILYDFNDLDLCNPNFKYDEWLNNKYRKADNHPDNYRHILYDDEVTFIIDNPTVNYEGDQDIFIDKLSTLGIDNSEDKLYKYVFGGTIGNSSYDEFEIYSNTAINFDYQIDYLDRVALKRTESLELQISRLEAKLAHKKERLKKSQRIQKIDAKDFSRYFTTV